MSDWIELKLPCPSLDCGSSDAFHRHRDGHGYCFSCKYYEPKIKKEQFLSEQYSYEYLNTRGLNRKTLEFYDLRTKINSEGQPISIGFRYPSGSYKVRQLEKKEFYWEGDGSKGGLFGRDKFPAGSHKYVTITEGEFDAASVFQVLDGPAVSVSSSSSASRDCAAERSWLNSFERIYLAFDADGPGRDATLAVAKLFDYNKIYVVNWDTRKDANEYLQAGEETDLRNIWWNAKRYLPETVISISKESARKILTNKPTPGIPYPFPTLNHMTYGIRKGESVLVTAQEGVGKTELMHSILHKLLKDTSDDTSIGGIFLEEPKARLLQSLAGLEMHRPAHLPDSGCSDEEVLSALEKVLRVDERLHIYAHFGSDDPEVLLDTIRFMVTARNVGYVILDHISMVVSGLAGEDERRALDYISTRLQMMVKELNFALILVSHVNDNGQTRGSRYIAKVADIRIDADRDLNASDPVKRNTTYLKVSKNRFCGRTGPAGALLFDTTLNKYTEVANDNNPGNEVLSIAS